MPIYPLGNDALFLVEHGKDEGGVSSSWKSELVPICKTKDRVWPNSLYRLVDLSNGVHKQTVAQLEWLILWPCGYCITSLKSELKGPSCKFIFKDQIKIDLSVWVTIY